MIEWLKTATVVPMTFAAGNAVLNFMTHTGLNRGLW